MAKRDLVIGTAGHIDHGKTALVRALTGVDTDRLPAEKQRGITIDLGFASLDMGDVALALVDVPGHERFIRNMLAGATGLDLALFVVAADDSVMPQTREHLEILRLLRLEAGVIALTKCDLAEPTWLALVEDEVRLLVAGTFLEGAPVVRTSSATGDGIDALRSALGDCARSAPAAVDPGPFRMAIDRAFTVAGHGTVVTGTVASGSVSVGEELEWMPEGRTVRVRGLQRHEKPVESVGRGTRAAVNVVGVHHTEVRRGQELAAPGYLKPARVLSVAVQATEEAARPLRHRGRYRLHLGTAEVTATLSILERDRVEVRPGDGVTAQLLLAEPVTAVWGQPFVLREESPAATLGGGRVLRPTGRRLRRRDVAELERLRALGDPDPSARSRAAIESFGLRPWGRLDLCREAGVPTSRFDAIVAAMEAGGDLVEVPVGPHRTSRLIGGAVAALEDRVVRALDRLHAASPRQSAIPRGHLASALADLESDALVSGLVERLRGRGKVVCDARTVALKGFEPKLSQGERKLKVELLESVRRGGFSPPDVADLTAGAGNRGPVVPDLLAILRDEERLTQVSPQLFLDADTAAELRRRVLERLKDGGTMTMADLRDLLGTSRKYAVPIGEYLDRLGLTLRDGDIRRLAPGAPATEAKA
jgi:selenocysteine-specific elongation factor